MHTMRQRHIEEVDKPRALHHNRLYEYNCLVAVFVPLITDNMSVSVVLDAFVRPSCSDYLL